MVGKIVRESISFERGGDPRKTMKVGKIESLKKKYNENDLELLLLSAAENGNLEDVKYLYEQGASVGIFSYYDLQYIEKQGYHDVVDYLKTQMNDE